MSARSTSTKTDLDEVFYFNKLRLSLTSTVSAAGNESAKVRIQGTDKGLPILSTKAIDTLHERGTLSLEPLDEEGEVPFFSFYFVALKVREDGKLAKTDLRKLQGKIVVAGLNITVEWKEEKGHTGRWLPSVGIHRPTEGGQRGRAASEPQGEEALGL